MKFTTIDNSPRSQRPDVVETISRLNAKPDLIKGLFTQGKAVLTRAPGRLDVMGGIADYSGSLVMPMPLAEATFCIAQKNDLASITVVTSDLTTRSRRFSISLARSRDLADRPYDEIADYFKQSPRDHWASYAAGVFVVLQRELGATFDRGVTLLITSNVPAGKGVSSSAALEVAVMQAAATLFDINIGPREHAVLCQRVENRVVGAACGVMDQVASHYGVEDHLIRLVCQPADILSPVAVPDEIEFWGIDSGVRHAVAGSDYASVRTGAFMGYSIIAEHAGLDIEKTGPGSIRVDDPLWNGYLANIPVDEYEKNFRTWMPETILGRHFLEQYAGITDTVTRVHPERTYAVRPPAEHAIYESSRVARFSELLLRPLTKSMLDEMGNLMFASHQSYVACGLTEPRTDRLVEMVRERVGRGVHGARITGGGSGGTVVVLARKGSSALIRGIADLFEKETGYCPRLFHGSSPGCAEFGHLTLLAS